MWSQAQQSGEDEETHAPHALNILSEIQSLSIDNILNFNWNFFCGTFYFFESRRLIRLHRKRLTLWTSLSKLMNHKLSVLTRMGDVFHLFFVLLVLLFLQDLKTFSIISNPGLNDSTICRALLLNKSCSMKQYNHTRAIQYVCVWRPYM